MSVIAKDFSPLVQALRQKVGRTSFSFRFEDLFTKEEWLHMSVKERTRQEREFIARMHHIPNIRMPFLVKMAISSNCIIKSTNIMK